MISFIADATEFCRVNDKREGTVAIADLARVSKEAPTDHRSIQWSIVGGSDQLGHAQIAIQVDGAIELTCQRCLKPVDFEIASSSLLILAATEEEADAIEALLADDATDVVVADKKLAIAELIEDEILLAIPQSVKHDVCPAELTIDLQSAKKPSAFAVLKDLKLK